MALITPKNTTIILSRYNEDTTWTTPLVEHGFRVIVYDHIRQPNNPYYVPVNQGREASAYLKYIIDHYDHLPTFQIFLQAEDRAWHHNGSLSNRILSMYKKKTPITQHYKNLNKVCLGNIQNQITAHTFYFFDTFLAPYIGNREKYFGDWTPGNLCCAQFIVHKSRILKYPLKFYQDIYNWILTSKQLDEKGKGHMLEWTWFLIFDNPNPKRDPNHLKKREKIVELGPKAKCR